MELFPKLTRFLRHKANVNKFKKIEITPCIISDQNRIRLDLKTKGTAENIQANGD
jgi:hypothetical protein